MTPAERHRQRMAAKIEAEKNADPANTQNHTAYERQLVLLAEHKRQLKSIQSIEKKIELKKQLIPDYAAYIAGVLEADAGGADEVVTTLLLWCIDAGYYEGALELAEYCLRHNLPTPDAHQRTMGTVIAEEFADYSLKGAEGITLAMLQQVQELTKEQDMPDQVRAKLHKAIGYELRETDKPAALTALQRALELNTAAGVKKDIEKLEREIKAAASQ
ncbi:phage terminase small subunit [Spongiibacter taiwanensis]|uniref:phage terminase small subunit n=1 Tax=Spongiibacter taiwanensis TaxID=1748242 RepID=UPI002035D823|nr:phage terminase small subunit [Spongiibacter taiwanensis]USA43323.1 phage terminase small subunit [Spongiibacter taiwanensis]